MSEQDRPPLPADLQAVLGIEARPDTAAQPEPVILSRTRKILIAVAVVGGLIVATIGFAGSYAAVSALAEAKHFGAFSRFFPIGIDTGIAVLLSIDLVFAGFRMHFAPLRPTAWILTAATICFNAASSWGDWIGVGMHATIPLLFVIIIEAARFAIGRIADITADRHIESPPLVRWLLAFPSTFRIWRRMRLWQLRSYTTVVELEREAHVFRTRLRLRYGHKWRTLASEREQLALELSRYGVSVRDTLTAPLPDIKAEDTGHTALSDAGQPVLDTTRTSVSTSADNLDKPAADKRPDNNVVPMPAPRTTHRTRSKTTRTDAAGHDGPTLSGHVRQCLADGITDTDTILKSARDKFGPDTKRETVRRLVSRHTPEEDADADDRDQLTGTDG